MNETALRRHLRPGIPRARLGRFTRTFDDCVEKEICDYLKALDDRFYGIPKRKLRHLWFSNTLSLMGFHILLIQKKKRPDYVLCNCHIVLPVITYPRKRNKKTMRNNPLKPHKAVITCTESGNRNSEKFFEWFGHFMADVRSSTDYPVILLLDNHSSYLNYEALCYEKENYIHMLTISPHGSHQLQPLDVRYFSPLKLYYGTSVKDWLSNNLGQT